MQRKLVRFHKRVEEGLCPREKWEQKLEGVFEDMFKCTHEPKIQDENTSLSGDYEDEKCMPFYEEHRRRYEFSSEEDSSEYSSECDEEIWNEHKRLESKLRYYEYSGKDSSDEENICGDEFFFQD